MKGCNSTLPAFPVTTFRSSAPRAPSSGAFRPARAHPRISTTCADANHRRPPYPNEAHSTCRVAGCCSGLHRKGCWQRGCLVNRDTLPRCPSETCRTREDRSQSLVALHGETSCQRDGHRNISVIATCNRRRRPPATRCGGTDVRQDRSSVWPPFISRGRHRDDLGPSRILIETPRMASATEIASASDRPKVTRLPSRSISKDTPGFWSSRIVC